VHMFLKLRSAISICATLTFLGAVCVEATVQHHRKNQRRLSSR